MAANPKSRVDFRSIVANFYSSVRRAPRLSPGDKVEQPAKPTTPLDKVEAPQVEREKVKPIVTDAAAPVQKPFKPQTHLLAQRNVLHISRTEAIVTVRTSRFAVDDLVPYASDIGSRPIVIRHEGAGDALDLQLNVWHSPFDSHMFQVSAANGVSITTDVPASELGAGAKGRGQVALVRIGKPFLMVRKEDVASGGVDVVLEGKTFPYADVQNHPHQWFAALETKAQSMADLLNAQPVAHAPSMERKSKAAGAKMSEFSLQLTPRDAVVRVRSARFSIDSLASRMQDIGNKRIVIMRALSNLSHDLDVELNVCGTAFEHKRFQVVVGAGVRVSTDVPGAELDVDDGIHSLEKNKPDAQPPAGHMFPLRRNGHTFLTLDGNRAGLKRSSVAINGKSYPYLELQERSADWFKSLALPDEDGIDAEFQRKAGADAALRFADASGNPRSTPVKVADASALLRQSLGAYSHDAGASDAKFRAPEVTKLVTLAAA